MSFCFPHGIQAKLLPRTPEMSALQDIMYSQRYQQDDSLSFVFLMKVLSSRRRQRPDMHVQADLEKCPRPPL